MIDWRELFIPSVSVFEIVVRGSLVLSRALCVTARFVFKRATSTLNIGDLLMIVLVADAAQNAMSAG